MENLTHELIFRPGSSDNSASTNIFQKKLTEIEKLQKQNKKLEEGLKNIQSQLLVKTAPVMKELLDARLHTLKLLEGAFSDKFYRPHEKKLIKQTILEKASEALSFGEARAQEYLDKYQEEEEDSDFLKFKNIFKNLNSADESSKELKPSKADPSHGVEIKSLYRKLAKSFHPDSEQDEDIKSQKNKLMQDLTTAYENNNIYELLKLQAHNLGPLEGDEQEITKYTKYLNKQIKALKHQKKLLTHWGPLAEIYQSFYSPRPALIEKKINAQINNIQDLIWKEKSFFDFCSDKKALRSFLKKDAKERKTALHDDEDLIQELMDDVFKELFS
jgi:hypothetical protein